jgi:hypothetical protein
MSLNSTLLSALKYGLPALCAAGASIAVAAINSNADLEKARLGIESLAKNYNELVAQTQRDHDELEELRGAVSVLSGQRAAARNEPRRPERAQAEPPASTPQVQANPDNPPPTAAPRPEPTTSAPSERPSLSALQIAALKQRRSFTANRVPNTLDALIKAQPAPAAVDTK